MSVSPVVAAQPIRHVLVVIPARDEEERIGACLRSVRSAIRRAAARLGARMPTVSVVVVADGCRDDTVAVASATRGTRVVSSELCNVGAARALGVATGLAQISQPPQAVWIANTDADSTVPVNWIIAQLGFAARGFDVVVGSVRPSMGELTVQQRRAWLATHPPGATLGHVHGANLGVRADVYLASGGFPARVEHEDNDLVAALADSGARIAATEACEVTTSGRPFGRTTGGYARYLREDLLRSAASVPLTGTLPLAAASD